MNRPRARRETIVAGWLALVFLGVCGMVILGGLTRLTGSGLSMVEWRPLMGTLPPMSEAEWQRVFALYQDSPQYRLVNHWMDREAFQQIFWLEYLHRLLGRSLGLVAIVPWVFFLVRGWLDRRLAYRTLVMVLLGGLQGGLGWFMVMSGLVDVPEVSHLRLTAHLALALLIAMWALWTLLDVLEPLATREKGRGGRRLAWGLVALVGLQCIYGALMAGTRAGLLFATFPDLNGAYSPLSFVGPQPSPSELVTNPALIHYVHRLLAWTLLGYSMYVAWALRRARPRAVVGLAVAVGAVALAQFCLGVATVLFAVPVRLASAHQGGALVMLSLAVCLAWAFRRRQGPRVRVRG